MALGYACVATLVLLMTTLQARWLFALLFWPTLWIVRAVIALLAKIPSAEQRRDEKHTLS
jgi:hypothetical protein